MTSAPDLVALVRAVLAAAGRMDVDAIVAEFDDAVVMELPDAPPPLPRRYDGIGAVSAFQYKARGSFSAFAMHVDAVELVEPLVVVAHHRSEGVSSFDGRAYRNTYTTRFEFTPQGRIVGWREQYDADAVRAAFFAPDA